MTIYKLFDIRILSYLTNMDGTVYFTTSFEEAETLRWECLKSIQPPNMLMEVIKVHVFTDGIFNGEILNIHLN